MKTRSIDRLLERVSKAISYVAMSMLVIMALLTTADVAGRYLLNNPIPGTFEISKLAMVVMLFWGLAYVWRLGGHIAVDILTDHLPKKVQAGLNIGTCFLTVVIMVFIARESFRTAIRYAATGEGTELLYIPVFPFQLCVSIGSIVLALEVLAEMIKSWAQLSHPRGES